MTETERSQKQREQEELLAANDFVYLGNGPAATGEGLGWNMSENLCLKCVLCGYMMIANPFVTDYCFCGALYKDADWGRVGSKLGDGGIEVYQVQPKQTT